jgi:hypothetical protein
MTRTAQCACGSASISVNGEPRLHVVCHCTNCKRRTGSAFGVSAYFLRSDLTGTSGEMSVYAFHHTAENHDQERHFCSKCGTTLFWSSSNRPHLIGIAAGCFSDDSFGVPTISATSSKKLPWVALPGSCKVVER